MDLEKSLYFFKVKDLVHLDNILTSIVLTYLMRSILCVNVFLCFHDIRKRKVLGMKQKD